jgi:hypothetical protein
MAIEFDIRIIGENPLDVIRGLGELSARMAAGLGVGAQQADATDPAPPAATEGDGADKPVTTRKRTTAAKPEPETTKASKASLDRAAIIDGLTKIYSKGDEDVRLAITKFRDGQGADRLRDLKDDALPAAAELLIELKTAADQPQV